MLCNYCGTHNLDTATVCQRCGRPIGAARGQQVPPPPPLPNTSSTNALAQHKNRGYVIAGSGALVALFAFFFLPYFSASGSSFGQIEVTWTALPSDLGHGLLWFDLLLTLAALIIAALLLFRSNPFGMTTTPLATQTRRGIYALIGSGILSILIQLVVTINTNAEFQLGPDTGFYYRFDIGYWVYMLAMGAVIVGGVMALRTLSSSLPPQAQRWQQPPSAR